MPVRSVIAGSMFALAVALPVSCSPHMQNTPFSCPWAGEGTATVQISGNPGAAIQGGTATCASGAYLNVSSDDREVQFCSQDFDVDVAVRTEDTGTGVRTVATHALVDGSARVTFTALSPSGNASYESAPDGVGTITITSNFANGSDPFAGTFQAVHMNRISCTDPSCDAFPATITISGMFSSAPR